MKYYLKIHYFLEYQINFSTIFKSINRITLTFELNNLKLLKFITNFD